MSFVALVSYGLLLTHCFFVWLCVLCCFWFCLCYEGLDGLLFVTHELLVFYFRFCFCCVHCLWFVLSVLLFVVLLFCFCLCCSVLFSSWACSAAPPLVFDRIPWTAPWPKPANCGASLISDRPGHQTNWTNPCPNKSCELRACRRSRPAGR